MRPAVDRLGVRRVTLVEIAEEIVSSVINQAVLEAQL